MSVSANSLDKLSEKLDDAKRSINAAASESEAELKAKVDEARKTMGEGDLAGMMAEGDTWIVE